MNRFSLFALLFCFFIASSYAQDSTKTATPKSAEKPVLLAPPAKTNKITLVKPDTGKNKAAINKIVYKKPDSKGILYFEEESFGLKYKTNGWALFYNKTKILHLI